MNVYKAFVIWIIAQLVVIGMYEGQASWSVQNHIKPDYCSYKTSKLEAEVVGMLFPLNYITWFYDYRECNQ